MTGLDATGAKISNTQLITKISQINKDLKPRDYLRLIMQYFHCFDFPQKDKDTMLHSIKDDADRRILKNLEYLDGNMALNKKFKRRREEMTLDEFNDYARTTAQLEYETTRCLPNICKLIQKIHLNELSSKEFPYSELEKP